ncbi:fucolectin-like [Pleurodeles waltl]|uniref:fucolectin-like n=1 Tax=Pleurodeles waltl TaxID=8319 RepID=UPI003709A882
MGTGGMLAALIILLGVTIQETESCFPEPGGKNLARKGSTSQSSRHAGYLWATASRAIDGEIDGDFHKSSCSHTQLQMSPWWMVDLKQSRRIGSIIVYGRKDCCQTRLIGAEVRVGNTLGHHNPVCGTFSKSSVYHAVEFCCNGKVGRYISVIIPERKESLSLCEVEVYGLKRERH